METPPLHTEVNASVHLSEEHANDVEKESEMISSEGPIVHEVQNKKSLTNNAILSTPNIKSNTYSSHPTHKLNEEAPENTVQTPRSIIDHESIVDNKPEASTSSTSISYHEDMEVTKDTAHVESETVQEEMLESAGSHAQTIYQENVLENELRRRRNRTSETKDNTDNLAANVDFEDCSTDHEEKGKEPEKTTEEGKTEGGEEFNCNICFDTATEPVLTICGHLFCWSCLVQWLERSATCPVCKAGCDKEKVIPVYGRGREEKDPRMNTNIPNRPAGQRPPPPPRQPNQFFGFDPFGVPNTFHGGARGGNFVFTTGFGFLPALMGFSYTFSGGQAAPATQGAAAGATHIQTQQPFVSRVFMMIAAMVLVSIIFY